jgi:hypothetical protein
MVYAAPPLVALTKPPAAAFLLLDSDLCWAPRGGLCGGDGIPELTSGTPPGPERPRSVLEAREGRRSAVHSVAGGAHGAGGGGGRVDGIITTTVA